MKSVMVLIHEDAGQEARLQCALDVVRAVEGHLLCLDVLMTPIVTDGFGMGGGNGILLMEEREREDANVDRLEPRLANEGVSYEWARVNGASDAAITDNARLIDLIVVGKQGFGEFAETGAVAARLAAQTSAPILLVPGEQKSLDIFGSVLVAWDGSAAADAAIRAAVPLLRLARDVRIVTIGEDDDRVDPNDVAVYLDRHGCTATTQRLPKQGDAGAQLLDLFGASGADWAVMGCYGHSKLREQLFGGTTRTLLAKAGIPVLLSH